MRVLLDGNIYNKLEADPALLDRLKRLISDGRLTVLCNQVVEQELLASRYNGIPDWLPVERIQEQGAFIGYAQIAPDDVDSEDEHYATIMPDVSVYSKHRGRSKKSSDAIIADTAARKCDYLVSEDNRLIQRMDKHAGPRCNGVSFSEFREIVSAWDA
jgi:predicted nucleic acid-binding protein